MLNFRSFSISMCLFMITKTKKKQYVKDLRFRILFYAQSKKIVRLRYIYDFRQNVGVSEALIVLRTESRIHQRTGEAKRLVTRQITGCLQAIGLTAEIHSASPPPCYH
jgi:hypothetical protein